MMLPPIGQREIRVQLFRCSYGSGPAQAGILAFMTPKYWAAICPTSPCMVTLLHRNTDSRRSGAAPPQDRVELAEFLQRSVLEA